ncbi:hypothetical protein ACNKHX_17550 [Shigella flexneri]
MLNASGGVIDDLIVYYLLKISSASLLTPPPAKKTSPGTRHAEPFGIEITVRDDLSMIAVQGPMRRQKLPHCLMTPSVGGGRDEPFFGVQAGNVFIATTGYTVKRAMKLRCPMKSGPICGLRWWKRVSAMWLGRA